MIDRYERLIDLFFLDDGGTNPNPNEEGQVKRVNNDLVAYLNGSVYSLTQAGALPPATSTGQVLYSADGSTFTAEVPITAGSGWLVNGDGILLVV